MARHSTAQAQISRRDRQRRYAHRSTQRNAGGQAGAAYNALYFDGGVAVAKKTWRDVPVVVAGKTFCLVGEIYDMWVEKGMIRMAASLRNDAEKLV